jgi:hypothetical protein
LGGRGEERDEDEEGKRQRRLTRRTGEGGWREGRG